jgi:hypothetical protein
VGTKHNSTLFAWQGIYLFMGAFTLGTYLPSDVATLLTPVIAPIVYYLLPNSPATAKFLDRGQDRLIALERLRENNTGTKVKKFNWAQCESTCLQLQWLTCSPGDHAS